ncbi:hypothetical protein [Bacillus sp. B1-b2]|nr:hypothetical protein [Bacillus sp. B1-b2]
MFKKLYKGYLVVVVLPINFILSILFDPSGNLVRMTNDTIKDL